MRILIMAGGTGGHIFPALAVAKRLKEQDHEVYWLGTRKGMEGQIVTSHGFPIHFVRVSGLRGKGLLSKLIAPLQLSLALLQSIFLMLKLKPQVVLGMGGYVTGPGGIAAYLLRRRLVIHEQNAVAGATNKILAKFSKRVLEGFPQSFPRPIAAHLTGNPVREDFYRLPAPEVRLNKKNPGPLKILVLGGSHGARAINNIVPELIMTWGDKVPKPYVWHQAGARNMQDAKQAYHACGFDIEVNEINDSNIKLVDFIHDMPNAYAWADIVICRAGALTVAELSAAGVASILIPYPYAVDDHQTKNAQYLLKSGAAMLFQERDLEVDIIRSNLQTLALDRQRLTKMAAAARGLAKPEALDLVVAGCVE